MMNPRALAVAVACFCAADVFGAEPWTVVRVTSDQSAAAGCRSLGMVSIRVDATTTWRLNTEVTYERLKRKAAEKGANLVVLLGGVTSGGGREKNLQADGEAYACKSTDSVIESCRSNFALEKSIREGSTFTTHVSYSGLNEAKAAARMSELASQFGFAVHGDISARPLLLEAKMPRDKKGSLQLTMTPEASGLRVDVVERSPLIHRPQENDSIQNNLCDYLSAVVDKVATAKEVKTDPQNAGAADAEERLAKLESLYKKKLITKDEYEKKRAAILKDL